MSVTKWRLGASYLSVVIVLGLASTAQAQTQPTAAAEESDDNVVIVTAQKRSENAQKVPISIAAFDNVALHQGRCRLQPRISAASPATVQVARARAILVPCVINIRGIGSASNTTIEPSVAVFQDGVYIPRAGAIVGTLLDMDSVEILRGPQGTLFGRNASVGALSLHSATPKA